MTTFENIAVHEVYGEYPNRRLRSLDPASFDRQISRSRHRRIIRGFALGAILGVGISWAAVNVPLPFIFERLVFWGGEPQQSTCCEPWQRLGE